MTFKKTLPIMALFLLIAASGTMALAQPKAGPGKAGPPPREAVAALSPEDRAALDGLWRDHRQTMMPLKDQMWAKRLEYDALAANPNSKPTEVKALIDEMVKLRVQMRGERESFFKQLEDKGFGPGSGKDWRGHGFHRAYFDGPDDDFGPGCGFGPGKGRGPKHGGGQHWRGN